MTEDAPAFCILAITVTVEGWLRVFFWEEDEAWEQVFYTVSALQEWVAERTWYYHTLTGSGDGSASIGEDQTARSTG